MLVSSPDPATLAGATLNSSKEIGLDRCTNGFLCFLSSQLCASLQPWRLKSCHPWGQHGQQHRQPAPQGQRVQPAPQPGAHSELTVCAGSSLLPDPVTDSSNGSGLVCVCPQGDWAASPVPSLHPSFLSSRGLLGARSAGEHLSAYGGRDCGLRSLEWPGRKAEQESAKELTYVLKPKSFCL